MHSRFGYFGVPASALIFALVFAITPARAQTTYNVKSFGAKGNGHDDDTTAIRSALSAASGLPIPAVVSGITFDHYSLSFLGPPTPIVTPDFLFPDLWFHNNIFLPNTTLLVENAHNGLVSSNTFIVADSDTAITLSNSTGIALEKNTIAGQSSLVNNSTSSTLQQNTIPASGISAGTGISATGCGSLTLRANKIQNIQDAVIADSVNSFNVVSNTISNYRTFNFDNSQNGAVRLNRFTGGTTNGIALNCDNNVLVDQNVITDACTGIAANNDSSLTISNNRIAGPTNFGTGVCFTGNSTRATSNIAKHNNISLFGRGIFASGQQNFSIDGNTIRVCQEQGIREQSCTGLDKITNNVLSNCGLKLSDPAAVIFVDDPTATSIPITGNFYSGNTKNLQYFIWCKEIQPPAVVAGNRTNTMLMNRIGQ